jgi:5-methylcytosine-specific restriction endonuclease McrA
MAKTNTTPKFSSEQVCEFCNVAFKARTYRRERFCSKDCFFTSLKTDRSKWITVTCAQCGKEFECYKKKPLKHCSHACAGKTRVANIRHFKPTAYTATCEICKIEFRTTPGVTRGRFCSSKCFGVHLSRNKTGENNPLYGRKFDRPKLCIVTLTCLQCRKDFKVKRDSAARRRCCSKKCQGIYYSESGRYAGKNSPVWRGGYAPYYGESWLPAKRQARERDKVCRDCGKTPKDNGRALDVHHIVPFRVYGRAHHAEANDPNNLMLLCQPCHKQRDVLYVRAERIGKELAAVYDQFWSY